MYSGQGSTIGVNLTGGATPVNEWSHVVAAWDGTTAYLYHDGTLVDSGSGPYPANTDGVLSIATYDNGDNSFHCSVDEVAIYGSALLAGQVADDVGNTVWRLSAAAPR